jgi:hypothetical protein
MDTAFFWSGVASYNEALWPVQVVMIALAGYLTVRVVARPGPRTDLLMKVFLALAFAWNGVVFFLIYVRSPIATFVGAPLFIAVAVLFVSDAFTQRTRFRFPHAGWARGLTIGWLALAALYPVIGWLLGHVYPRVLLPMFPCPLTVFATALVAAAAPRVDKRVFAALLPWGLLGLPKCFGALDCYEDAVLFAAGAYGLVVLVRNWRSIPWQKRRAGTIGSLSG